MDPDQSLYPQSPQPIGRVLDAGFRLFRAGFGAVLPLSMLISLLMSLPKFAGSAAESAGSEFWEPASWVLLIVVLPLYLAGYQGTVVALDAVARGAPVPSLLECFVIGLKRLGASVVGLLLYGLVVGVGLVLILIVAPIVNLNLYGSVVALGLVLLVPGQILMISLGFVLTYVALEQRSPFDSLKASRALVRGHWWRTATIATVAGLLFYLPDVLRELVEGVASTAAGASGKNVSDPEFAPAIALALTLLLAAVSGLLLPLLNAIMLAQFNDLKLRRSGSDLLARATA